MSQSQVRFEARSAYQCFKIANKALFEASQATDAENKFYHSIVGITFVAFAFEAMLNHYTQIYFPNWGDKEHKKERKERHRLLFDAVGLVDYRGNREYQNIQKCVLMRDYFAHGKTESVNTTILLDRSSAESEITQVLGLKGKEDIYNMVTPKELSEHIKTLKKIQEDIETTGKYPDHYVQSSGLKSRTNKESLAECPLDTSGVHTWS